MKIVGIIILAVGLILGGYALNMDVSVHVPAQDYGYGIRTPALDVANADKMAQRQNFLIFSGVLAVVGAILTGFASMRPSNPSMTDPTILNSTSNTPLLDEALAYQAAKEAGSISICSKCRSMEYGEATECKRCGEPFATTA